jgi:nucleotide sugar dehydrogenase
MNKIAVVGCGKLGICYAISFAKAGYTVYCYDVNHPILDNIKNDTYNYTEPFINDMIKEYKSNLVLSYDLKDVLDNCDLLFSFIQTPSTVDGSYDHTYINNFIDKCIAYGKPQISKTIAINSTVMPEYCNTLLAKLKDSNYNICYNPSFIAQGSIINNIVNPDFILIGADNTCVFQHIIDVQNKVIDNPHIKFHTMTLLEAEITKIATNCFITNKISYANMVGDLLKSKGCNPDVVLNAIGTDSRIGNKCMKYGYGYGGPCLPRDNRALCYYAKNHNQDDNINFNILNSIDENNKNHLSFQLNEYKNKELPIVFEYITYKDTSDILEESQKLKLAIMLADKGFQVVIKERQYIIERLQQEYPDKFEYEYL